MDAGAPPTPCPVHPALAGPTPASPEVSPTLFQVTVALILCILSDLILLDLYIEFGNVGNFLLCYIVLL